MKINAQRIAQLINGKIEGDENVEVSSFGKIEEAQKEQLAFIANPKYEEYLYTTNASIIIVNDNLEVTAPVKPTIIRVKDAYSGFALLLEKYHEIISQGGKKGIEQPSYISPTATIG